MPGNSLPGGCHLNDKFGTEVCDGIKKPDGSIQTVNSRHPAVTNTLQAADLLRESLFDALCCGPHDDKAIKGEAFHLKNYLAERHGVDLDNLSEQEFRALRLAAGITMDLLSRVRSRGEQDLEEER